MRSSPLVSVIIPAYNCANFIEETLASVYAQTYTNWEIIVIDDGSTDETKKILEKHMSKIHYSWQQNQGVASARNTGIQLSKGELLAFLDNDDLWMPEKLERQVKVVNLLPQCGLVFTDGKGLYQCKIVKKTLAPLDLERWTNFKWCDGLKIMYGNLFDRLLLGNIVPSGSCAMVRKVCFEQLKGFDPTIPIADDYDMWIRISQCYEIAIIAECLFIYRIREASQSGPPETRKILWRESTIPVAKKYLRKGSKETVKKVKENFVRLWWANGWDYLENGQLQAARKSMMKCLRSSATFLPASIFIGLSFFGLPFFQAVMAGKRKFFQEPIFKISNQKTNE